MRTQQRTTAQDLLAQSVSEGPREKEQAFIRSHRDPARKGKGNSPTPENLSDKLGDRGNPKAVLSLADSKGYVHTRNETPGSQLELRILTFQAGSKAPGGKVRKIVISGRRQTGKKTLNLSARPSRKEAPVRKVAAPRQSCKLKVKNLDSNISNNDLNVSGLALTSRLSSETLES